MRRKELCLPIGMPGDSSSHFSKDQYGVTTTFFPFFSSEKQVSREELTFAIAHFFRKDLLGSLGLWVVSPEQQDRISCF
jgi:hypothetical protein